MRFWFNIVAIKQKLLPRFLNLKAERSTTPGTLQRQDEPGLRFADAKLAS